MQLCQVSLRREERNHFFSQARDPVKRNKVKGKLNVGFLYKLDNKIICEGEIVQQMSQKILQMVAIGKSFLEMMKITLLERRWDENTNYMQRATYAFVSAIRN